MRLTDAVSDAIKEAEGQTPDHCDDNRASLPAGPLRPGPDGPAKAAAGSRSPSRLSNKKAPTAQEIGVGA
jgi:hypothetical protein